MSEMDDRDHYEHDENDSCPLCNRSNDTCRCSDDEIEDWHEDRDEMLASDFEPHHMGDGKRFHVRQRHGKYQVYGLGLAHICECEAMQAADMIAAALEQAAQPTEDE